jgi:hypothetical protein
MLRIVINGCTTLSLEIFRWNRRVASKASIQLGRSIIPFTILLPAGVSQSAAGKEHIHVSNPISGLDIVVGDGGVERVPRRYKF